MIADIEVRAAAEWADLTQPSVALEGGAALRSLLDVLAGHFLTPEVVLCSCRVRTRGFSVDRRGVVENFVPLLSYVAVCRSYLAVRCVDYFRPDHASTVVEGLFISGDNRLGSGFLDSSLCIGLVGVADFSGV